MKPTTDPSLTTHLTEAASLVLPALEQFLRFDCGDLAASQRQQWLTKLNEVLPESGAGATATLEILARDVIPNGNLVGAPGFSGWITTMPTIVPALAGFAGSIAGAQRWWLQSFNFLEHLSLEWLKQLLGISKQFQGVFTSGGSVANLVALGAARQKASEQLGCDAASQGISCLREPRIYVSEQGHHAVNRAAASLGLGRTAVVHVPVDAGFQMKVNELRRQIEHDRSLGRTVLAVVGTAGTTNTGAIDPLRDIAQLCAEQGVWMHVDGAYGAFGVLDGAVRPLFEGLHEADSIVIDPHKWLGVPVGCGAAFVRHGEVLRRAFTLEPAEYLEGSTRQSESIGSQFDQLGHEFHDFGLEQSAQSRGVCVWAALKEIGASGIRERVRTHNGFARELMARVQASAVLELCAPVTLSICCFRYAPTEVRSRSDSLSTLNKLNREILARLHSEHNYIPSGTELNGMFVIRPCYVNARASVTGVAGLVDTVLRLGAEIWDVQKRESRG